jgi:hypothetical protein
MLEGRLRREVDLLLGQLGVNVRVHEAVTPGQQSAGHDQGDYDGMPPALVMMSNTLRDMLFLL